MWDKIAEIAIPVIIGGALTYGGRLAKAWITLQEKKLQLEASELEAKKVDEAIDEAVRATEEEGRANISLKSEDKENLAMSKARAIAPEIGSIDEPVLRQKIKAKVNAKFNDRCE